MKLDKTDKLVAGLIPEEELERTYAQALAQVNEFGEGGVVASPSHSVRSTSPRVTTEAKGSETPSPEIFSESGSNRYIKLPDRVPQFVSRIQAARIYDQMVVNDATVDVSLRIAKTPILGAFFYIQAFDDQDISADIAEFVTDNIFNGASQPFLLVLEEILRMFDYGFMMLEPVWEQREWAPKRPNANRRKYTMIRKLGARHAPTISEIKYDDHGELVSVIQRAVRANDTQEPVTIPVDKVIPFSLNKTGGNIEGRALDPDTTIPTFGPVTSPSASKIPSSYSKNTQTQHSARHKTLAEIQVGDIVYDIHGRPTQVVAKQEWENRPLYDVTISTGDVIRADGNHEWIVLHGLNRKLATCTTEDMFGNVKNKHGVNMFAIPRATPLWCPDAEQLIHPYVLGQWLGDGTSQNGEITTYHEDLDLVDLIQECGYEIGGISKKPHERASTILVSKLATQLRTLGLRNNKYIPPNYIYASYDQRLALIQGLMDSDGTVDVWGRCEFTNTNDKIVDAFLQIIRSLGCKARAFRVAPSGNRKQWITRVHFVPPFDAFRTERKITRQREAENKKKFTKEHHMVRDVQFVGYGKSICIEVNSPTHTFLCGETLVPTHNSLLRTAYKHWYYKDNLYKIDAIQKERHAIGVPRASLAPGYTSEDLQTAWKLVTNLRTNEHAGIVQPPQIVVDFAKMEGHIVDVIASIEHHEARIMLNVFAEFMLLGLQGAGGRSTAGAQVDTYQKAYRYVANMICDTFNRYLVPKIVNYNYDTDQYPIMKARGLGGGQDLQQFTSALANLVTNEVITADFELEQWAREQMDAPLKKGNKQTLPISREVGEPVEGPPAGNNNGSGTGSSSNSGPAKGSTPQRTRTGNQPKGTNTN